MPDALPELLLDDATPAPLPLPGLSLDGQPFRTGTVVVVLAADRAGTPLHSTLVWHSRVVEGVWTLRPRVLPRDQGHLAPLRRRTCWVIVSWAGRRIGERRVRVEAR